MTESKKTRARKVIASDNEVKHESYTAEAKWLKERILKLQGEMVRYSHDAQHNAQLDYRKRYPRSRPEDWIEEKRRLFGRGDLIKAELTRCQSRLINIKDKVRAEHDEAQAEKTATFSQSVQQLSEHMVSLTAAIKTLTQAIDTAKRGE